MKSIVLLFLLFSQSLWAHPEAKCQLYRSGVFEVIPFGEYTTIQMDDPSDPACLIPMGRICRQITVMQAELRLPGGLVVRHEIRSEGYFGGSSQGERSVFTFSQNEVSGEFHGELFLGLAEVNGGGYTLTCR